MLIRAVAPQGATMRADFDLLLIVVLYTPTISRLRSPPDRGSIRDEGSDPAACNRFAIDAPCLVW